MDVNWRLGRSRLLLVNIFYLQLEGHGHNSGGTISNSWIATRRIDLLALLALMLSDDTMRAYGV